MVKPQLSHLQLFGACIFTFYLNNLWATGLVPFVPSGDNSKDADSIQIENANSGMRAVISANGYTIYFGEQGDSTHYIRFEELTISRSDISYGQKIVFSKPFFSSDLLIQKSQMVDLYFRNDAAGLHQDFVIKSKPSGTGNLTVSYRISSDGVIKLNDQQEIEYYSKQNNCVPVIRINGLKLIDNDQKLISGNFELSKLNKTELLNIQIDDKNAAYPIRIDPILTTPNWSYSGTVMQDYMGSRTEGVGDVNGDGFDDVIVTAIGAEITNAQEGIAYLFYGSPTGLSATPAWTFQGDQGGAYIGESVSHGDVNNDGYEDIFIGSSRFDVFATDDGVVFGFFGGPTGPATDPDWYATSGITNTNFGFNVCSNADFNNDGYDDLAVSLEAQKKIYIYYGSPSGLSFSVGTIINTPYTDIGLGYGLAVADVNGDGFTDVIASGKDLVGAIDKAQLYVFSGNAGGVSTTFSWSYYTSFQIGTIASANDVNGDGYDDIIALKDYPMIFMGSSSGLELLPVWINTIQIQTRSFCMSSAGDVNNDGYDDVIFYDNFYPYLLSNSYAQGVVFYGSALGLSEFPGWWNYFIGNSWAVTGVEFSSSVGSAGDVNNDGYDDFLIGAPRYSNGGPTDIGRANLYLGGENDFDLIYNPDERYPGVKTVDHQGMGAAGLGDINNDGFDDLAIGTPDYDAALSGQGKVNIYYGTVAGPHGSPDITFNGNSTHLKFGYTVCGPGDVTGDGFEDMLVSSLESIVFPVNGGKVRLYKGSASGMDTTADLELTGIFSNGNLGKQIAACGDVNGDGKNDFLISEPGYDGGQTDEGRVLLFYGASPLPASIPSWSFENNVAYSAIETVSGKGDLNGDGYNDVVISSITDSPPISQGIVYVFYGSSSGLPLSPNWTKSGTQSAEKFGLDVSIVKDVNNDGFDDLVISTDEYDGSYDLSGLMQVYYGSPTGLASLPNLEISGDTLNTMIGSNARSIGDYNNDGYNDIIYSVFHNFNNVTAYDFPNSYRFCILNGSSNGLSNHPDLIANPYDNNADSGNNDFFAQLGGDFNGDGIDDFFIASPGTDQRDFNGHDFVYDAAGSTDKGDVWIYLGKPTSCVSPVTINLISATTSSLNISWTFIANADHYDVRFRMVGAAEWGYISSTENSITLSGLIPCTSYEIQIQTLCNSGAANWTSSGIFSTSGCATCGTPIGLVSTILSPTKVKLSWVAVAGATKYKITYRQTGGVWTTINATTNTKSITGLTPGTTYEWKVKTICGGSSSAYSPIANFTTPMRVSDAGIIPQLQLFPNPNAGNFNLFITNSGTGDYSVSVLDISGREIAEKHGFAADNVPTMEYFDLKIPAGIYMIKVNTVNGLILSKIIVQ